MVNLCNAKQCRPQLSDTQIAANVRTMYDRVLDICADKAIKYGEDWRKESNVSGCASNAQLWILGDCLGDSNTFETDADLQRRIALRKSQGGSRE